MARKHKMAINTSGHRVSVMPRYTPVDPALLAFNPGAAVAGFNDVLKIGKLLDQIKFDRAKEKELEDTRAARIAAANAQNKSLSELFPIRTNAERLKTESELSLLGDQTRLSAGRTANSLKNLSAEDAAAVARMIADKRAAETVVADADAGDITRSGKTARILLENANAARAATPTTDAQIAAANLNAAAANAQMTEGIPGLSAKLAAMRAKGDLGDLSFKEKARPISEDTLLKQAIFNRDTGDQRNSIALALEQARLAKTVAEADVQAGTAQAIEAGQRWGGSDKAQEDILLDRITKIDRQIAMLQNAEYALPGEERAGKLALYEAKAYKNTSTGEPRMSGIPGFREPVPTDPRAEAALEAIRRLRQEKELLLNRAFGGNKQDQSASAQSQKQQPKPQTTRIQVKFDNNGDIVNR